MTLNSEEFWHEKITSWERSGQKVRHYCRANQLCPSTFYEWKRKLLKTKTKSGSDEMAKNQKSLAQKMPSFVEVVAVSTPMPQAQERALRITTSYGAVVELPL